MFSAMDFMTRFVIEATSPLDALTVFLNKLLGSNQTPDGYLMYLLVMCGLFVIGLVLIYNWWEERKFNAQVEKSFSPIQNDALLDQNKKQFLDKFAATTGYLSDAPDANSFAGQKPAEVADEKSIDDVYSELLDTMTKRTQKSSPDTASTPAESFDLPNMVIEPKDAPLPQQTLDALPTTNPSQTSSTSTEEDATQNHAIRSIIDQVFRSKSQAKPVPIASETAAPIKSEMLQNTVLKDESVLDAYLSVKKTMAIDSAESQAEMQAAANLNNIAADETSSPTVANAGSALSSMMGLSLVKNASESTNETVAAQAVNLGESVQEVTTSGATPLPVSLNLQVDYVGVLSLEAGVTLDLLVESLSALYKDFDKPVFVHIQDANKQWLLVNQANRSNLTQLVDQQQAQKVVCSMQLADRSGAASRNVINRFQMAFESIAVSLGGRVQWQNEGDIFSQAMALDAFCIEVDKTMFFHLMHEATGPFTGIKLKGIAESQGMKLANDGSFKYFGDADSKYPEFVMFNRDNHPFSPEMLRTSVVKAVTFQLDIPHTLPQAVALDHMVAIAKYMEVGLNAALVDDNNRPLADMQIERIRDQIKSIHAMMQLRGIVPGSDIAHRLFS